MSTRLQQLLKERGISAAALAKALDVHKSQITRWAKKHVPAERVPAVSYATGIPPHELRPTLFPAPQKEAGK